SFGLLSLSFGFFLGNLGGVFSFGLRRLLCSRRSLLRGGRTLAEIFAQFDHHLLEEFVHLSGFFLQRLTRLELYLGLVLWTPLGGHLIGSLALGTVLAAHTGH